MRQNLNLNYTISLSSTRPQRLKSRASEKNTTANRAMLTPSMADREGCQHHDDGEFHVHSNKKSAQGPKRIYIGNLPSDIDDLEERIQKLLKESVNVAVSIQAIHIERGVNRSKRKNSPHALIECPAGTAERIISKLNKFSFEGQCIVVQRERRAGPKKQHQLHRGGKNNVARNNFRSWAQPSDHSPTEALQAKQSQPTEETTVVAARDRALCTESSEIPPDLDEVVGMISEVVTQEFEEANRNGDDLVNLAIASTAAMTMLASTNGLGMGADTTGNVGINSEIPSRNEGEDDAVETQDDEIDFKSRIQGPLSALLADFGEADPNWMNQQPDKIISETLIGTGESTPLMTQEVQHESRLGQQGKAPIHVEFTSFGYYHGAPQEVRNGWSHMQPLEVTDCRDFPAVPHYLEWQDGLSGPVKRALLEASKYELRKKANNLSQEKVVQALEEAIADGHGYALPLTMVIFVGSHAGRHRSVLFCELAATALRKILRTNAGNRITTAVSVGTHHSHIERKGKELTTKTPSGGRGQKKIHELEGDW